MADNILESYFIRVGAIPDTASFAKLGYVLKDATKMVEGFSLSAVRDIFKFQAAAVGTFAAIGLGLINLADKTAMTDQSYRLFGLRMMMTKGSARAMQVALDELGATIDEVAYDPELNKRFQYLYEQNIKLGKLMGGGFDKNMRMIRDLRMEYKMFTTEFEFMVGGVISSLFTKLGFSSEETMNKLQNLNEWFTDHLPDIEDQVSDYLIPVWDDFKAVISDVGDMFETTAGDFTYLVGVLSGDTSIEDTTFKTKNLGKAFQDIIDDITKTVLVLDLFEKIGMHAAMAVAKSFGALGKNFTRVGGIIPTIDWKGFKRDATPGADEAVDVVADIRDIFNPKNWGNNKDFSGINAYNTSRGYDPVTGKTTTPDSTDKSSPEALASLVDEMGRKYNINPELLAAIIHQESGGNAGAISPKRAKGLMQLMPRTAFEYGVSDSFNPRQNVEGGAHYFADLLKKYHNNTELALAAYNAGPGKVDRAGGIPQIAETQNYVKSILDNFMHLNHESQLSGGQVVIENMVIQVPHNIPPEKWKDTISDSFVMAMRKQNTNTMAQTAGGAHF